MMTIPDLWNSLPAAWPPAALINHRGQSTAAAMLAWMLTLALRNQRAGVRYWLWFIASMKFLFPLGLLSALGEALRPSAVVLEQGPAIAAVAGEVASPFPDAAPSIASAQQGIHLAHAWPLIAGALWFSGVLVVAIRFFRAWRQMRADALAATPFSELTGVPVLTANTVREPGVFGIFHPRLLLPAGILDRLTPAQMDAIFAHELCHVRRGDNLTYALHMIVQTLFWFCPPVWFIGSRLIDERERACDEATVQS